MFTGLVETVQAVQSNEPSSIGRTLALPLAHLIEDAKLGDSICVNGVCLTISRMDEKRGVAWFDVMQETVKKSTLADLKAGDKVNMERAMVAGGRLGGHIVQGHVDGIGKIDTIDRDSTKIIVWISADETVMKHMIEKGSVAIDGISLTIVDVEEARFSVSLIPTTWEHTNLQYKQIGSTVNLEADIISKWIIKRLDDVLPGGKKEKGQITIEKLMEEGFA